MSSAAQSHRDVIDADQTDRDTWDDLFGPQQGAQLPVHAPPRPDAYAAYMALAQGRTRGDPERLQRLAIRIGELTGEDGYYSFPAGGSTIEGPSVKLAKALANAWGSCGFGVEIDRIEKDRVYLTGVCVDFLAFSVVRRGATFGLSPAPSKFANRADQKVRWETMQVQSGAAKALRGAILDCLPSWFVEPAFEAARESSRKTVLKPGQTIEGARDDAAKAFAGIGVDRARLEAFIGSPLIMWSQSDIARLRAVMRGIREGEMTADEAIPAVASQSPQAAEGDRLASVGLGGQRPAAQPQTAQAPAAAPAANSDPKPAASRPDAAAEAQLIRDALVTQVRGSLVPTRVLREKHREALKMARIGDERHLAAVQYGADQGWWTVETDGIRVPGAPAADRWAPLLGEELAIATSDVMERLGDDLSGEACRAVGVSVDAFDSATDDELRRLGRELDRIEAQLRASEGA